jgi:hypothetical protein
MKSIPFLATLLIATAVLAADVPAGWKVLTDRSKNCQIGAPQNWVVDAFSPSSAGAPDKKSDFTMHCTTNQSLAQVKGTMQMMFPPIKVIEDTKDRLWYSYKSGSGGDDTSVTNWYVGIPSKSNVCGVQIEFKDPSLEPVAKQIANSMSPAK